MGAFKRWALSTLGVFRVAGVGLGAVAMVAGLVTDVSGSATFLTFSPKGWIEAGVVILGVFGALSLLRHEYLMHEFGELWGNEYARKLLIDGIPPYRDIYFQYVASGDYPIVQRFWKAGHVGVLNSYGQTDLYVACINGHASIARGILEHGADPQKSDREGRTPLMIAASRGHLAVVELLMQFASHINATASADGVSALYAAASNNHSAIVELLLKSGARVDLSDHDNISPLAAAISAGHWKIAEILMDAGADPRRADKDGATLLDYAVAFEAPDSIQRRIRDAGASFRVPRLHTNGRGQQGTGKIRVVWESVAPETAN